MIAPQIVIVAMVILAALLTAGYCLRRELLSILGPIVFYDMVRLARRLRYFLLRFGYGCVLIGLLLIAYFSAYITSSEQDSHRRDVLMAQVYFGEFMFVQLFAVSILVPAYVAGAIADEKERKTLEFILATPVSSFEIVVGKLIARIANLVLFVLIGLPILSLVQFLGGIDPNLLLAGFAATVMTIFGLGGFSIFCSVAVRKPRRAITVAFLGYLLYVFLGLVGQFMRMGGVGFLYYRLFGLEWVPNLAEIIGVCNAGNVLVGSLAVGEAAAVQANFYGRLFELVLGYGLFHLVAGLLFTSLAVWQLRPMARRHFHGDTQKPGARPHRRPDVSDRPILWKEKYVEGKRSRVGTVLTVLLYVVLIGFGTSFAVESYADGSMFRKDFAIGVTATTCLIASGLALIMFLLVAIRAAGCIAGERDKNTLDGLLVTPLDADEILRDKLRASMLRGRHLAVMIAGLWIYAMIFGGTLIVEVVILCGLLYLYTRSWAQIGLWFSVGSRSSSWATIWTVVTYLGLSGCCYIAGPWFILFYLPFFSCMFRHESFGPAPNEAILGIVFMVAFMAGNVALYAIFTFVSWPYGIKPHFRKLTLRNEREPSPLPSRDRK